MSIVVSCSHLSQVAPVGTDYTVCEDCGAHLTDADRNPEAPHVMDTEHIDLPCDECGAEAGEPCFPTCTALDPDLAVIMDSNAVLELAEAAEPWSLRVTTLSTGGSATACRFKDAMAAARVLPGFFEAPGFVSGDVTVSLYDRDRHVMTYSAMGAAPVAATGYDDLVAATTDDPEHPALTTAQHRIAALRGE